MSYSKKTWTDGSSVILASDMNRIEGRLEELDENDDITYRNYNVTTASEDLDDYLTPGTYSFAAAYTPSNAPSGAADGWVVVIGNANSSTVKQVWYTLGTAGTDDMDTYVRTYDGTNWSSWVQYATLPIEAADVPYSSTSSGLSAANVQSAVDELDSSIDSINTLLTDAFIYYDEEIEVSLTAGTWARYNITYSGTTGYTPFLVTLQTASTVSLRNDVMLFATSIGNFSRVILYPYSTASGTITVRKWLIKNSLKTDKTS